ncbi:monovalent cation/H(+) antiporter subunit G [Pseudonocardia sp.]|uniref:monovalent cation/H(+) antiporter subunit G n=1 Tax=Pseudonocardia sp. TaxID=60912 RepID=UPI0026331EE2|nr:monovalent cation/H(+) antiporter subunit G [Pseudonocardia sp.]MCW2720881.1 hypothetical protein [Pseudonocardia sp.]
MTTGHVVVLVLLAAGVLVAVASAVGAVLVREAATRLHFLTPVTSVAGPLLGAALAVENGWSSATGQVLVVVLLLVVTGPVLGSATGRLVARERAGERR